MSSARSKIVLLAACGALALASCTGTGDPGPTPESTIIVPDQPGRGPVDDATIELEFAVYEALEYDPYEKAIRYSPDTNELVVTIWTFGDVLLDDRLEELQERAQHVAGDADVLIRLVDNEGNTQVWTP